MANKSAGLKEPQKDMKTKKLEKKLKKRKVKLKNEKICDKMVITDFDYEKLINQIELFTTRMEKLPDTIFLLSEGLKFATRVIPKDIPAKVVTMNSYVKIKWMNTGNIRTIKLVYPEYEDTGGWKISVFSPLGAALLGWRQGNETIYRIRKREFKIKILELVFQPEANGNYYYKKEN